MAWNDRLATEETPRRKWYRLGLLIAVANLIFIGLLLLLLEYDLVLGLTFAVVVSVLAGIAITVYALRQA